MRVNTKMKYLSINTMIRLSEMTKTIQPSLTRKLFDMAKEYNNVIDFTLGDPDLITPLPIRKEGCRTIMEGKTKYSQNAGILPLRKAISKNAEKEVGLYFDSLTEIMVTVGGMGALYLSLLATLNAGDEVIILAPYWINYPQMVLMCGGKPVIVDTDADNNFSISTEAIEKAISDKTRAVIINSPSNPSGFIIKDEILKKMTNFIIRHDLFVISDEVYKSIIYDEYNYKSIITFNNMRERTILVNSFSKRFSMTGWRIGYVIAPQHLITKMTMLQENVVACAPLPSQYAAIKALECEEDYLKEMVATYKKRRDILVEGINKTKRLYCQPPQATFYALVNIQKTGFKSEEFAYSLLKKEQVAVVPGITYGKCCDNHIRIAYTLEESKIKEGINRINKFIKSL